MNRVIGKKYIPLHNYLKKSALEHIVLPFSEIEHIINAPLPQSAYNY
ncbi:hypothetical protein ACFYKT_18220 [Cytobacillus sp. FJAT-53684]|uniref:Uncharacterized protein n=1 Tax=Cytobacillus mangrovibacter TaxID=3299024 RepID=A0ABW6K273_9BACI